MWPRDCWLSPCHLSSSVRFFVAVACRYSIGCCGDEKDQGIIAPGNPSIGRCAVTVTPFDDVLQEELDGIPFQIQATIGTFDMHW